jgi:hypothetical protein
MEKRSATMRMGNKMAAASITGMVKARMGVATAPTPPPKPALEIPIRIMAKNAVAQKSVG